MSRQARVLLLGHAESAGVSELLGILLDDRGTEVSHGSLVCLPALHSAPHLVCLRNALAGSAAAPSCVQPTSVKRGRVNSMAAAVRLIFVGSALAWSQQLNGRRQKPPEKRTPPRG